MPNNVYHLLEESEDAIFEGQDHRVNLIMAWHVNICGSFEVQHFVLEVSK